MFRKLPFDRTARGVDREDRARGSRSRLFRRGDFKYVILDLLLEKPSYGYELIRAMEERFHGEYAPSPGVVYPTLQMLEEMGYATSSESEGRRVYSITETGKALMEERRHTVEGIADRMGRWFEVASSVEWREALHDLRRSLARLQRLIEHEIQHADAGRVARIRKVLTDAYHDIEVILTEPAPKEE